MNFEKSYLNLFYIYDTETMERKFCLLSDKLKTICYKWKIRISDFATAMWERHGMVGRPKYSSEGDVTPLNLYMPMSNKNALDGSGKKF